MNHHLAKAQDEVNKLAEQIDVTEPVEGAAQYQIIHMIKYRFKCSYERDIIGYADKTSTR